MNVLGLDIGGANTKAAYVRSEAGILKEIRTAQKYFPMWKNPDGLSAVLTELTEKIRDGESLEAVGVTMTAELSDTYQTKREGVNHILNQVKNVFSEIEICVMSVDGTLRDLRSAREEPLKVAAANWAATGWLVSKLIRDCVVVDVGSTSASIIPIAHGDVSADGVTDLEKLINGELVYTGSLRTNVATIVSSVPTEFGISRVSSELFATSGDVHLILGNISAKDYNAETADGKDKTKAAAFARLARVVCADLEMLSKSEIVRIAQYVYHRQVEQVADGLTQVYKRANEEARAKIPVVITGLGKDFLARRAAEKAGIGGIIDFNDLVPGKAAAVSTAVAVAFMLVNTLEGGIMQWRQ